MFKNAIVDSVTDVYDMMLSMEIEYTGDSIQQKTVDNCILGSINIVGAVVGIVNIDVSETLSREMVASMLEMDPEEIEGHEEIQDVLGEVCNMVAGSLKSGLCDAGMECELSTPALIIGQDYQHEAGT